MDDKKQIFTQETIDLLVELGNVLHRINQRMKRERYHIIDGEIRNIVTGKFGKRIQKNENALYSHKRLWSAFLMYADL